MVSLRQMLFFWLNQYWKSQRDNCDVFGFLYALSFALRLNNNDSIFQNAWISIYIERKVSAKKTTTNETMNCANGFFKTKTSKKTHLQPNTFMHNTCTYCSNEPCDRKRNEMKWSELDQAIKDARNQLKFKRNEVSKRQKKSPSCFLMHHQLAHWRCIAYTYM